MITSLKHGCSTSWRGIEIRRKVEDCVELQAEWPAPAKAARRLAGHANASRGASILWIIGLDERRGVTQTHEDDLANWWVQVAGRFDGLPPDLHNLRVPVNDTTLLALLFSTERAPFVVKNPEGGTPEFEVPWRDGTRIRSARRADLVRILSPLRQTPSFEVLSAQVELTQDGGKVSWSVYATLYQQRILDSSIVIPLHRCSAKLSSPGGVHMVELEQPELTEVLRPLGRVQSEPSFRPGSGAPTARPLVEEGQIELRGPARVRFFSWKTDQALEEIGRFASVQQLVLNIELEVLEGPLPVTVEAHLIGPVVGSHSFSGENSISLAALVDGSYPDRVSLRWRLHTRDSSV
ncbi:MAG: hypothetical protein ACRDYA_08970 [Egibacteraceae bacterium]